jgi:hypothetical protein
MSFKLVVEKMDPEDFEYIVSEESKESPKRLYIKGPMIMADDVNRNDRIYPLDQVVAEVKRYTEDMIDPKRAMGELNHPTSAEVDLERACHIVESLSQDGNVFVGTSKVLSTPMGKIVENLIFDGVKLGMSTRSLGKLEPVTIDNRDNTVNKVSDMKLVAIDCVADPSYPDAFVNGILESKEWILNRDGSLEELYEEFEKGLENLPRNDVDSYLRDEILSFINRLK